MSDNATPAPDSATQSAGCCGPTATERAVEAPAATAPCCGTVEDATAADTCCDPAAKHEAVAAGAGCC
ncbi:MULTISPECIES: hypothetical protein [Kitasatospora]|uniref:hypothetical protein n=1 Tax=Kitasatospora TaxID=2063 RepID=UPI002254AF82|nr:hypothetical protein [Kitasatospora purpeofusca]MCX4757142.1 hypothetical protein [Kitasatospora purpeofusca]WSR35097.1 hypothetical protein OG715_31570 [Kitasatospora purpeofusca]WSR43420.1 hypothetical protein OG196_32615 [Kitasatospora purpeofusca]